MNAIEYSIYHAMDRYENAIKKAKDVKEITSVLKEAHSNNGISKKQEEMLYALGNHVAQNF